MKMQTVLAACLLCFLLAVMATTFTSTPAYAAPQQLAESKTGLGEVFKSRAATGVGPNKKELFLTATATVIMIACVKYL
jgi:hypothetical protein